MRFFNLELGQNLNADRQNHLPRAILTRSAKFVRAMHISFFINQYVNLKKLLEIYYYYSYKNVYYSHLLLRFLVDDDEEEEDPEVSDEASNAGSGQDGGGGGGGGNIFICVISSVALMVFVELASLSALLQNLDIY